MNIDKVKSVVHRLMDVNKTLVDNGGTKLPMNFVGSAGIGK